MTTCCEMRASNDTCALNCLFVILFLTGIYGKKAELVGDGIRHSAL